MKSKRSHEGYLMIHHAGPPLPDEFCRGLPLGAGRGLFEAPTYTCSHCQRIVILNQLRNRERAYCRKCDHYICDACGAAAAQTGICRPFKQIIEEAQETVAIAEQALIRGIVSTGD